MKHQPQASSIPYFLAAAVVALAASRCAAAELRLRAEGASSGPVVKLSDVAEIVSGDARQTAALAAIELFPAPTGSEEKVVRVREIQDLLLLRGINLAEHQFSGSSEVVVRAAAVVRPTAAKVRSVSTTEVQRIKRRLRDAIAKYLNDRATSQQDWAIAFPLTEAVARLAADPTTPIEIAGGAAPWTGRQQLEIIVNGPQGPMKSAIDATIHAIAPVVVAVRPLSRGAVIREGDIALQRVAEADKSADALHSVEEVVGRELVRAVGANSPITSDALRSPIAVHRGEVVSVFARAGGVRIRTNARCRDDGGVGELVAVESLANRSTYYARVSGVRQVEVYARPPQAENQR